MHIQCTGHCPATSVRMQITYIVNILWNIATYWTQQIIAPWHCCPLFAAQHSSNLENDREKAYFAMTYANARYGRWPLWVQCLKQTQLQWKIVKVISIFTKSLWIDWRFSVKFRKGHQNVLFNSLLSHHCRLNCTQWMTNLQTRFSKCLIMYGTGK